MPKWIRVRDTQTGHTFDIDARVLKHRRGVEPIDDPERWPDVEGPRAAPRPAKPFVNKDGRPRAAGGDTDAGEQSPDATSDGGTAEPPPADGEQTSRRSRSKTTSTPPDVPADTSDSKENQR